MVQFIFSMLSLFITFFCIIACFNFALSCFNYLKRTAGKFKQLELKHKKQVQELKEANKKIPVDVQEVSNYEED